MTVAKKVLVIAGGVAVVAIGTAVVVVTCPAIAAQAGTYILANGCLVAREILSSVFAVGGVAWLIWDYFRSGSGPSASSASYHHRNQQQPRMNAQGLQVYHHWETNPIPLSSRSPSTYQSSRGRRHERSNSVVSMVSDFELELPLSVFDQPRSPGLAATPFSMDARSRASSRSRSPTSSPGSIWTLEDTTRSENQGVTTIIDSYVQRGLRQRFSGV